MYAVGKQNEAGVPGLRLWPHRSRSGKPAFNSGETVAYFLEAEEGEEAKAIATKSSAFFYNPQRSTAYKINTSLDGRNNLRLGKRALAVDGVRYWAVVATRKIRPGEWLMVPCGDANHRNDIRGERDEKRAEQEKRHVPRPEQLRRWQEKRDAHRKQVRALAQARKRAHAEARAQAKEKRKAEKRTRHEPTRKSPRLEYNQIKQ